MEEQKIYIPVLRFNEFIGDWIELNFEEILSLRSRPTKMEDENEYSLVTVKRRFGGVVNRGIYKGKNVLVKSQFKLKANDFLISKRQIVHNACGLVPIELEGSIVSNEYCVFVPKSNLDINYFHYFCQQPKVSQTFLLSSIGVHIEKMLFKVDDWLMWKFRYPILSEQRKIATFITSVDKSISLLIQKKETLEQYKKGVMQKIFAQEIRFKDDDGNEFPDWDVKPLGEVLDYEQPTKYLVDSTEYRANYSTPVLTAGKTFILGYTNETYGIFEANLPVIIFDDFTTAIQFVDFPFKAKSSAMKILLPLEGVNIKFVFEAMSMLNYTVGGHERHWISKFSILDISIPCPAEQTKIANFLSAIDEKISLCNTQIAKTEQYKKGLLQQMFV